MIGNTSLTILVVVVLFVGRIAANDPPVPTSSNTPGALPDCVVQCFDGNEGLSACVDDTVDTQCVCKNIGRLDSAFVLLGCFEMKCHDGADEGLHAIEAICGQSMTGIVASAAPTNTSTTISSTVLASSSARPYHTETITVSQTTITDHLAPTSSITTSSSTLALAPATASGPTSDSATKTVSTSSLEASPSRASFSESPTNTSLTNAPSAPPAPMSNTNDANPQGSSSNAASKYGSTFWTGELGVKNTAMVIVCVYVLIAAV